MSPELKRKASPTFARSFFDVVRKFTRRSPTSPPPQNAVILDWPYKAYGTRVVHAIHTLPAELLAHIFVLGAQVDDMFPVNVSQVCSSWRRIALQTPRLWRRICLTPREEMWRTWIGRSRACPLDIQLLSYRSSRVGRRIPQRLDYNAVQWYMHLVSNLIPRWRSLDITFSHYSPFLWNAALSECCAHTRRVHAHLLEEIRLVYPANDDSKEFWLFNGYAPKLRRVTIDGIRLTWTPSLFGNLIFLDYTHHRFLIGWSAVVEVLSILQISNSLITLKLTFPWTGPTRQPPNPPFPIQRVSLPYLRALQLQCNGPDIPFELFQLVPLLSMPTLESLVLTDLTQSTRSFASLSPFFARFKCPRFIRKIRFEYGWHDHAVVSRLIRFMPSLDYQVVGRRHSSSSRVSASRPRKGSERSYH